MFIGAVNNLVRSVLWGLSAEWTGRRVVVACSGNFTVERIMAKRGISEIHGNDVSLYSCALGAYLSGRPFRIAIKDGAYAFLGEYLASTEDAAATLMLCSEWFKFADRPGMFYERMDRQYRNDFKQKHAATVERIRRGTEGVKLTTFTPADCVDFLKDAPRDAVAISFPPTYRGGYERLYKKLDAVFGWDAPGYTLFDPERFDEFEQTLREFDTWVTLTDEPRESLMRHRIGIVQTGLRSRPVHMYASAGRTTVAFPHQKVMQNPYPIARGHLARPVTIAPIAQGVMNQLRSLYLSPKIVPAAAQCNFAVLADGKLVGAFGFSKSTYLGQWCDAYMMTDFAIRPNPHKRLSKLILAAAMSIEACVSLEQAFGMRIRTIGTTAFTDKPVSMKYRGMFELAGRKEGKLNYTAGAGKWTLEEGMTWWMEKHANALNG